ncbi:Dishevelled associated activator of morphogenesis 2 [Bulinus truncatus]|nr:Dishevelled associated activator of morphogenesis 2 [Bulinus truncatus]
MPAKQGLCWCLGGSPRPPEIKHGLDIAAPLQPVLLDIPMPTDEAELNTRFEELVAELGLDKTHRDALYSLPAEKKWQIYCSKKMVSSEQPPHPHPNASTQRTATTTYPTPTTLKGLDFGSGYLSRDLTMTSTGRQSQDYQARPPTPCLSFFCSRGPQLTLTLVHIKVK